MIGTRATEGPAAALLDSVGLEVGGSVPWGGKVQSRRTGVYVVETAVAFETAPIDRDAVVAWLRFVPTLTIDGRPATAKALATRLASFWLPSSRVIYVGQTSQPLAKRVGQFYRTPLGKRSPHAGGHWLKTLTVLAACRVWWAETDEFERFEGDVFQAFVATVSAADVRGLYGSSLVLPFANLEDEHKLRKLHGIGRSVLR